MTPSGLLAAATHGHGTHICVPYEPYYRWVVGAAYMPPGEPCVCRHVPGAVKTTPYKMSHSVQYTKKRVSAISADTLLNFYVML